MIATEYVQTDAPIMIGNTETEEIGWKVRALMLDALRLAEAYDDGVIPFDLADATISAAWRALDRVTDWVVDSETPRYATVVDNIEDAPADVRRCLPARTGRFPVGGDS